MAQLIDITKYSPKTSENYFFDNNIWMYLFCPIASYEQRKQNIYSDFLEKLLSNNHTIFINSMILSEFANSYLRLDFKLWKDETKNLHADYKKDFVGTARFTETVKGVKSEINKILKIALKGSDEFNSINLTNVLNEFGKSDFNDCYFLELARQKNYKIVSDDRDLQNSKILVDVITIIRK